MPTEGLSDQNLAVLAGGVDFFTHATPDRLPRQFDDFELATSARAAGLRSVVHRNHYASTAERARLVKIATGFEMLGAVVLNETLGGINPLAAEHALDMGAAMVVLPTVSAIAYRADLARRLPPQAHPMLSFGPARLTACGSDGTVLPEVMDVLKLVSERQAVLSLGYVAFSEQLHVGRAAAAMGIDKIVITDPFVSDADLDALAEIKGMHIELEVISQLPDTPLLVKPGGIPFMMRVIDRIGTDRLIVSSDAGGMGPSPAQRLAWALDGLRDAGVGESDLAKFVRENPLRLVGNFLD